MKTQIKLDLLLVSTWNMLSLTRIQKFNASSICSKCIVEWLTQESQLHWKNRILCFRGVFTCLIFVKNCDNTYNYWANTWKWFSPTSVTRKFYTCRWTQFSSIGSILVSIITMLASIEQVNTPQILRWNGKTLKLVVFCNCHIDTKATKFGVVYT